MQRVKRYSKSERWPCGFGPVVISNQWTAQGSHDRNKFGVISEIRNLQRNA